MLHAPTSARSRCGLALVACLLLLAGCPDDERATTTKKRVVLGTTVEPDTLCPMLSESAGAREVQFLVARELSLFDPGWRVRPDLAAAVPTTSNGGVEQTADGGMRVLWRLRDDARWEDGRPLTADDFVFAWRLALDETQEAVERGAAQRVALRAVDGRTLEVKWREPSPAWHDFGLHPPLPAHVLRPRLTTESGALRPLARDEYCRRPLSNGPFRLVSWVPGQHMIFARNEQHRPRAALDEVVVRFASSTQALSSMLKAGDVDAVLPVGGLAAPEIDALVKGGRFAAASAPSATWAHLDFNLEDDLLRDARVRRALAHAVDRERAVRAILGERYVVADSFLPPVHALYEQGLPIPNHDPARAAALLDEAGFRRSAPGEVRRDAKGDPLKLVLSSASGQKESERLLVVLQAQWREIGVDVALDLKPFPVFFADDVKKRGFRHLAFYAWNMGPTSDGETLWRADRVPSADNGYSGKNIPGWRNDEVTRLLVEANTTLDEATRTRNVRRVQRLFAEELPSLPMYFKPAIAAFRVGVRGIEPTGTQTPATWNAASWDVARQP